MGLSNLLTLVLPGLRKKEAERRELIEENQILRSHLANVEMRHGELLQKMFHGKVALEQDTHELYRLYKDGTLLHMQDPVKGLVHLYTHMICSNLGFDNPIPPEFDA